MTGGFVNKQLIRFVPLAVAGFMGLWIRSCKITVYNSDFVTRQQAQKTPVIASFWHYSLLVILFYQRKSSGTAMVSSSKDGDYIAGLANRLGFATVRGSRNKKGVNALKTMIKAVRSGSNAALVGDGSQGPARIAQPGALLLSSCTGAPVVPIVWSASKYFTIKSWDRTAVPWPFSHIHYYYGEAINVPAGSTPVEMEEYRRLLEDRLNSLYGLAWGRFGKSSHYENQ